MAYPVQPPEITAEPDQRVRFHGVTWEGYESLLAIRGEKSVPRITYLAGEVELMSPSLDHEHIAKMLARLLEAYAEETGLSLNGYGSWTIKEEALERGLEPDECCCLGTAEPERPDLAIEVIWTGGIDKLEVYRELEVREVWFWKDEQLAVYELIDSAYVQRERSVLLPDLDLEQVQTRVLQRDQTQAVREFRAQLRKR